MIRGETFVYYGPEPWQSMWRNRHQLLSRLARTNRAVYVEPRPYVDEVINRLRRREFGWAELAAGGLLPEAENLWIYRVPRYAALGGPPPMRAVTHALRRGHLRRALAHIGAVRPIVWLSTPTQLDARFDLPALLRVYHIVDDYLAYHDLSDAQQVAWARKEHDLIDWADLVIAVSPELMASKGAGNRKFRLLPNAVDAAAYRERPVREAPVLAELPRPILGYIGLISVRLDLALLDALAVAHPEWTLVLVGAIARSGCGELLDRLGTRPNVHLLPPVPANEVPDYVRAFDMGLVPYRVTRETIHASPLKVYEYLAAGLPVVAADVPGARQFVDVLAMASALPEWEAAIAAGLAQHTPEMSTARRRAIVAHTWEARVETLSDYLTEALAGNTRP
ncbi:MAG: hypothetical protein CVU38_00335 [Chloroflexi bacterium HGW-Chloroflexi-1]|nr:MAG: hypothetical protein CVU38_00335 [Chloroflexi bacterium HGW-Chloroflexi-1]